MSIPQAYPRTSDPTKLTMNPGGCLLVLVICGCATGQVLDPLATFLRSAMEGFPAWAEEHNLEPTPIRDEIGTVKYSLNSWVAILEGEVWDLEFFGLTWNISSETTYSGTVAPLGRIRFHYMIPEAGIKGRYNLTGFLHGFDGGSEVDVPASGVGNFTLTCNDILLAFDEYFSIVDNRIVMRGDGINRGGTDIFLQRLAGTTVGGDFSSLIPPELAPHKDSYVNEINRAVTQGLGREGKKMVHGYFLEFIQGVFNVTDASDIIP